MVAVVLVVLSHLFEWPRGGFIGVDVFFVISGFLITGLLLREGNRSGRVSIANFYRRRARRILPVSLLVLGATVTAAYTLLLTDRFHDVVADALWSLAFLVNWHLAEVGTDYFQSTLPPSPLQHYWSLAVEEQFYLVWPLLIMGLLWLAKRSKRAISLQPVVAAFAIIVIAASFAWAVYQSVGSPTVAYFSTFTRAWELAAGALLAAITGLLVRLTRVVRNVMAISGLIGIFASAVLIDPGWTFPAPIGAVPILSTCLVIAAGVGVTRVAASSVLTLRPVVYLGTISYSLYLWHWPVIVLLESVMSGTTAYYVTALILMFALATASYHLIEKPILDSKFLEPVERPRGSRRRRRRRRREWNFNRDTQLVTLGGVSAALVFLLIAALNPPAPPASNNAPIPVLAAAPAAGQDDPLQLAVQAALETPEFPALTPPLDSIKTGMADEMQAGSRCLNPPTLSTNACSFGDPAAAQTAFVVGDSVAVSWLPTIRGALEPNGYRVHGVGFSNCPFVAAEVTIKDDPTNTARCNASRDELVDQINTVRPNLVILSDFEYGIKRLTENAGSSGAWTKARTSIIDRIKGSGARVVIVTPNPVGKAVTDCATRVAKPFDCVSGVSEEWTAKRNADEAAAEATGSSFVDVRSWFCYGNDCPIFVADIAVRWDTGHVTKEYGRYLAPRMQNALLG